MIALRPLLSAIYCQQPIRARTCFGSSVTPGCLPGARKLLIVAYATTSLGRVVKVACATTFYLKVEGVLMYVSAAVGPRLLWDDCTGCESPFLKRLYPVGVQTQGTLKK